MIIRSLRWRLVLAMVLIIAAVAATSGLFSSVTVRMPFFTEALARSGFTRQGSAKLRENVTPGRSCR